MDDSQNDTHPFISLQNGNLTVDLGGDEIVVSVYAEGAQSRRPIRVHMNSNPGDALLEVLTSASYRERSEGRRVREVSSADRTAVASTFDQNFRCLSNISKKGEPLTDEEQQALVDTNWWIKDSAVALAYMSWRTPQQTEDEEGVFDISELLEEEPGVVTETEIYCEDIGSDATVSITHHFDEITEADVRKVNRATKHYIDRRRREDEYLTDHSLLQKLYDERIKSLDCLFLGAKCDGRNLDKWTSQVPLMAKSKAILSLISSQRLKKTKPVN